MDRKRVTWEAGGRQKSVAGPFSKVRRSPPAKFVRDPPRVGSIVEVVAPWSSNAPIVGPVLSVDGEVSDGWSVLSKVFRMLGPSGVLVVHTEIDRWRTVSP